MTDNNEMRRLMNLFEATSMSQTDMAMAGTDSANQQPGQTTTTQQTTQTSQQDSTEQQTNTQKSNQVRTDLNNPAFKNAIKAIKTNQPIKANSKEAAALAKTFADIIRTNNATAGAKILQKIMQMK